MHFPHFDTLKSCLLNEPKGLKYTQNLNICSILKDSTNQTTDDLFEGFGAVRRVLPLVACIRQWELPSRGLKVHLHVFDTHE
jgi:hypothetical protein